MTALQNRRVCSVTHEKLSHSDSTSTAGMAKTGFSCFQYSSHFEVSRLNMYDPTTVWTRPRPLGGIEPNHDSDRKCEHVSSISPREHHKYVGWCYIKDSEADRVFFVGK